MSKPGDHEDEHAATESLERIFICSKAAIEENVLLKAEVQRLREALIGIQSLILRGMPINYALEVALFPHEAGNAIATETETLDNSNVVSVVTPGCAPCSYRVPWWKMGLILEVISLNPGRKVSYYKIVPEMAASKKRIS